MAKKKVTKKKSSNKSDKNPGGRPSKYNQKYCEMLIQHMSEGGSFESFGGVIRVVRATMYTWVEKHAEFSEAKDLGEQLALKFYEDIAKASMTGTLRRVTEEEYARDADGNVIMENGRPVIAKRKYAATRGDATSWGVTMRSRFRKFGYANKVEVTGSNGGPLRVRDLSELTDEELEREEKRMKKILDEE